MQLSGLVARFLNRQPVHATHSPADPPQADHEVLSGLSESAGSLVRPLRALGLLVVMPLLAAPADAGVYKWTDSSGQVHYTDQYQEGSEAVDLPEPSVYTPAPVPAPAKSPATESKATSTGDYDLLEVAAPAEGETVRSNEGKVTVNLRLEPTLRQGDKIELFLDGQRVPGDLSTTSATLSNLSRGTHSFKARVVNASGQALISSEAVSFHLRRQSKLFPQRAKPTPLPAGNP